MIILSKKNQSWDRYESHINKNFKNIQSTATETLLNPEFS